MREVIYTIEDQRRLARDVYELRLLGDTSEITAPGQFVNLKLSGLFLRRPISVADVEPGRLTLIYKVVGKGTAQMSGMRVGESVPALTGLGNGFDLECAGDNPLLIGGGVGTPPMYYLAKELIRRGAHPTVCLGFNTAEDVFYLQEFAALGVEVRLATADGSKGVKGFVTEVLDQSASHYYACGPKPMLKAVWGCLSMDGQLSFESRMGCGFGACMGCSCKTVTGAKRICREGPVLKKGEILWNERQ